MRRKVLAMALAAITYLDRVARRRVRHHVDIACRRAGALSGAMNTAGQVGAILSPILIAFVAQRFANPNASLYLTGVLFLMRAVCWLGVDSTKPVSD